MPSLRQIRRRIRSVQSTAKITRALEMIAASKLRRAQNAVLAGRPYSEKLMDVIAHLAAQPRDSEEALHPLLQVRPVKRIELVHITPDRGQTGGMNSNLNRRVAQFILEHSGTPVTVVSVGKKGADFLVRAGADLRATFTGLGDRPRLMDTLPISLIPVEDYSSGAVDEVYVLTAQFVSTTVQKPVVTRLLPVQPAQLAAPERVGYIYEPNAQTVLAALLPRFVEMEIYHAIQENIASEQSARMVAMRSATDNAKEMISTLTLEMNKIRQETITKELLDIVGAVTALEK